MCAALSPAHYQLRTKILAEAAKHVRETGFTNAALSTALRSFDHAEANDGTLSHIFSRGFPIALVEHIVRTTNSQVQRHLEATYSKEAILTSIDSNMDAFVHDRLLLPTEKTVAEDAVLAKVRLLQPLANHWPNAVVLEYLPSNLPYTVINLAEFIDTTAFYMERVTALRELLEPARRMLQSKAMASHIRYTDTGAATEDSSTAAMLRGFIQGIPLSSGPHAGDGSFNLSWYSKRARLAVLYGAATTSLLGDVSRNAAETRALTKAAVNNFF